jgi:glycerophosphoryl diester phosphodiesterase
MDLADPRQHRSPTDYPRHLGVYGYFDDHPLAAQDTWSTAEYLEDRLQSLLRLVPDVCAFYINHRFLAQSLDDGFNWAAALHEVGVVCSAWTLDVGKPEAEANAKRLLEAGVDQFTSNTPMALRKLLS